MRNKKWVLLMLIAIVMTSCTRPTVIEHTRELESMEEGVTADKVFLTFLYSGTDANWMSTIEHLTEDFMMENPNIILNMEPSDKGFYGESLKIKEAIDEFPDLFEIQNPYTFAEAGLLGRLPKSVYELVESPVYSNDACYAVPLYTTTYGIIYNRLMFKRLNINEPKTYDEFILVCKRLKAKGITPIAVGGSKQNYMLYWLNYFFQTDVLKNNPNWLKDKRMGKVSFTDDNIKTMFKHYQELFHSGYINENFMNMNDSQVISGLIDEEVAMVYTGPWLFSQIAEVYPEALISDKNNLGQELAIDDSVTFQLGWFFLPDTAGEPVVMNIKESNWAISTKCAENAKKLEAATKFLKYYYSVENYRKVLQSMNALPTTRKAVLYPSGSVQRYLINQYSFAYVSEAYLGDYDTPEEMKRYLYKMLNTIATSKNEHTLEQMLEQLDERWNRAGYE